MASYAILEPTNYFCHHCHVSVFVPPPLPSSAEPTCPRCHGGFIEEIPNPIPNSPEAFNPMVFLRNHLASMFSDHPDLDPFAGFDFIAGAAGAGGGGVRMGDYFVGQGLEELMQHLAENDPNRYGTPPAAKSAVEALPDVMITKESVAEDDGALCAVCKDEFEIGAKAKKLPCSHLYHGECIMPWLEMHNSCPVCRFELPTEDVDYENRRQNGSGTGSGSVSGSESASAPLPMPPAAGIGLESFFGGALGGDAGMSRSISIQFSMTPPIWATREGANSSNVRGGSAGSAGGSGSSGQEPRQEDLD